MFGQLAAGRSSGNTPSANRYFQYEIAGLRQTYETDKIGYPIRSSSSVFITVPYNRMNEEMQRITRLGGKIVNIELLTAESALKPDSESNGKKAKAEG